MSEIINLYEELDDIIYDRADKILSIYSNHFLQGDESIKKIHTDENPVRIEWDVRWQYGGYDSGSIYVPTDAFSGDWETWVNAEIQKDLNKQTAKKKKSETNKIKSEKAQLKRLKQKYEKQILYISVTISY